MSSVNPFQVYPVRGLAEVADVTDATVRTPEIVQVEQAIDEYVSVFGADTQPPTRLLLAAKGDFGTGKTHLMLYAKAYLATKFAALQPTDPNPANETPRPVVVMAPSSEAPVEEWFSSELGPDLVESARPRELVRELLTRVAMQVAREDSSDSQMEDEIRRSRKALYQLFREPGEFDISAVQSRFDDEIAAACPRTSRSFRRAINALRWEETADIVEDWLAGNELSPVDMDRIGVRQGGDMARRAKDAICAIAALCRRLGRPFALMIDEFEHLTRYDDRNGSKRNITWTKRLVELLARRGAVVFVSGHWEAWKQQDDFLDRFVGGQPIQLLRLTADDVLAVVTVRAGKGAWPGFTPSSAGYVVDATAGNIRRVMTVLFDLWGNPQGPSEVVTEEAVRQAARRRLQPGSGAGFVQTLEALARANDAVLTADETLPGQSAPFNAVVRLGSDVRLVVSLLHARDEVALLDGGEAFARSVRALRSQNPDVRGLCIALGAVIERHVLTLDAAFPETDLVNGEDPAVGQQLPGIVERALAPAPAPTSTPGVGSVQALAETRAQVVERADAQIARGKEILGDDPRAEAVLQASGADADQLANEKAALARSRTFEKLMKAATRATGSIALGALLRSPAIMVATGVTAVLIGVWAVYRIYYQEAPSGTSTAAIQVTALVLAAMAAVSGILWCWLLFRMMLDVSQLQRFRRESFMRLEVEGATAREMTAFNDRIEAVLASKGPAAARVAGIEALTGGLPKMAAP